MQRAPWVPRSQRRDAAADGVPHDSLSKQAFQRQLFERSSVVTRPWLWGPHLTSLCS
jgi:hypothetical protein